VVVSYAVVHGDPPEVHIADDIEVLQWVLALEVVARSQPGDLPAEAVTTIRQALLDQHWADAVVAWIEATGRPIDVYPSIRVREERHVMMGPEELQFTPLFQDGS
jgi:hypothetical protein